MALALETQRHQVTYKTEVLAYVEEFMTAFGLIQPVPTTHDPIFAQLLGALESGRWAGAEDEVRKAAEARLDAYYCDVLKPAQRKVFDDWVAEQAAKTGTESMRDSFVAMLKSVGRQMQGAQARTRLSRGARLTLRSGGRVGGQDWLAPPTPAGRRSRGLVLSPSSGHVAGVRTSFALTGAMRPRPRRMRQHRCGARRRRVRRQVVHADRGTATEALHTHQTRMTRPPVGPTSGDLRVSRTNADCDVSVIAGAIAISPGRIWCYAPSVTDRRPWERPLTPAADS